MRRLMQAAWIGALVAMMVGVMPRGAMGQADAQAAFADGQRAYGAGQFAQARDLFTRATQTDTKNAEAFLWLGKAHYQLGELDGAVEAWQHTLTLAPNEPYATAMLAALRGQTTDVQATLALIDTFLKNEFFDKVIESADRLLENKALTDAQRVQAVSLRAKALLGAARPEEAQETLEEILLRYPKEADNDQTTLLLTRARLHREGEYATEGLAALRKLAADHADTPVGVEAQYDLIVFDLEQGVSDQKVAALMQWMTAHGQKSDIPGARRKLIDAELALTTRSGLATESTPLSASDATAIAQAADLYSHLARAADAIDLTKSLLEHLDRYYISHGAYTAGIAATDLLLRASPEPSSRLLVMQSGARWRTAKALHDLADQAKAGRLVGGPLPQALADVLAIYRVIEQAYPLESSACDQAELAEKLRALGTTVPWPVQVTALKGPYVWAVDIDLPIVKANTDTQAVNLAVRTIQAIVNETAGVQQPASHLALDTHAKLLDVLAVDHPLRQPALGRQVELLSALALAQFNDNVRTGHADQNAKLSPIQELYLAALMELVDRDASEAPNAINGLQAQLQPWIAAGHFDLAEQALAKLSDALPEAQRRNAQLAVVNLWVRQAMDEHHRLTAAGLVVPRVLDDSLNKALVRLYELQGGVAPTDPYLAQVRKVVDRIISHYQELGYDDIALAAAKVKNAPANAAADTYAQFQLALLDDQAARRNLHDLLKNYKAAQKLAPTDSTKAAMAMWQKFITDHIGDPLALRAVTACQELAHLYEECGANEAAHDLFADLAAFAARQPALAQASPGQASIAEDAEFKAAGALDLGAHVAFARQLAPQPGNPAVTPPPGKISEEFLASDAAYRAFLKAHPDSPLAAYAVQRLMFTALDYARADAWDVADGIFASLLEPKDAPPLRDPQRLAFCRAMCQVGKVMPDHAKQVLAALAGGAAMPASHDIDKLETELSDISKEPDEVIAADRMQKQMDEAKSAQRTRNARGGGGAGGAAARPGVADRRESITGSNPAYSLGYVFLPEDKLLAQADSEVLSAISQQEARRAAQVAAMREGSGSNTYGGGTLSLGGITLNQSAVTQPQAGQGTQGETPLPALSPEELARQQAALDTAYAMLQGIRVKYARTATAEQCRGEIMLAIEYWRGISQWERASTLGGQFLKDKPSDSQLPQLRLAMAHDQLTWAAQPITAPSTNQDMLAKVSARFDKARQALAQVAADFPDERALVQQAQWEIATSFLTQARTVGAFSATLARGQYARAAQELDKIAVAYADHPQVGDIPQMLWEIAAELQARNYAEEAITVWHDLAVHYPTHALADRAAVLAAQTYQTTLGRPLRAAEAYVEINFARGGSDAEIQTAVYTIGAQLKNEKRWVESLHVLQLFVASFPRHASAGQALTMIGQIHQANQAWQDAIAAYQRVIDEYPQGGNSVQQAKWSIADCIINLSKWPDAIKAYESYVAAFPGDAKIGEANRRIGVLKDLANYQMLVTEGGPKAFDAQFQMALIIQTQLSNDAKAIEEYQKVATNYPECHLAGSALYAIGVIRLQTGDIEKAREVLHSMATIYKDDPQADDALFKVAKSYEDEAQQLGELKRSESLENNGVLAQSFAYQQAAKNTGKQRAQQQEKLTRAKGKPNSKDEVAIQQAANAFNNASFDLANSELTAEEAQQNQFQLTAEQLADRQDKINAALRKAVAAYTEASRAPGGDKAGDALLRMAVIYSERLSEPQQAMATWLEIVRQYSGTAVAEEASWQIAQNYEHSGKYAEAVEAYKKFLSNYRRSPRAEQAQFFIAENYEHLGQWVGAMDQYTVYLNNYPSGALAGKAREQINFIKTYRLF
jgi:TolA-binding protein